MEPRRGGAFLTRSRKEADSGLPELFYTMGTTDVFYGESVRSIACAS